MTNDHHSNTIHVILTNGSITVDFTGSIEDYLTFSEADPPPKARTIDVFGHEDPKPTTTKEETK